MPNNPYLESLANFNATLQAGKDLFSQFALAIQQKAQSFIPAPIDYPQPIEYLGASLSNTTPFSDLFSGKTKGEAEAIRTEMEEWFADRFDWFDQVKPSERRYPTTDSFAAAFKTWSEELKKWESLRSRLYTIAGTFIKSLPPYKTPEGAEILGHNVSEISKIHSIFKADKPNWLAKSFQELDDAKKQADLDYTQWELNVKKPDSVYFSDPAQKKQAEQDFSKIKKDSKKLLTKIKKEIDDVIVAKTPVLTYPPIEFIGVTPANFSSFEANLINLSIADLQNKNNDAFSEWTGWQIQAPKKPNKSYYPNDAEWQKADDEHTQKFQEAEKLYKDIETAIDGMIAKKQIVFPALEYFGYGPSDMNALTKGLVDDLDPVSGSLDIADVQDYKNDLPSFINGKIAEIQKLSSDPNFTTPEIDKWLKFQPKIEKALDDAIAIHQKKFPPSSSAPVSSGFAYTAQDGNVYTLSDLPAFKNYLAGLKTQKACKNEAAHLNLYAQAELGKLQQGTKEYNDFESTYNMFQFAILSEIAAKKQTNSAKKAGKNANTNPPQTQPQSVPTPTTTNKAPVVENPQGFPESPDSVKVIKRLGGSTGAELVEAEDGTKYVRKMGNNEGHIRSECYVDGFYRAAGADVPEFKLYDTPNGPVKLSRFFEGTQTLEDWWNNASKKERDMMSAELRKHYAVDILTGNWDVVGMSADNILIDKDGKPWRIDNGGALSYRAQGSQKTNEQWGDGFVDDLWTMTGNGSRIGNNAPSNLPTYFGKVDVGEMAKEIVARDWSSALDRLPPDQRAIVEKRLDEIRQLAAREADFSSNGFTREYTLSILDETYKFSKKGLREACSFQCDLEKGDFGWFRPSSGSKVLTADQQKDSDIQSVLLAALKTINYNTPKGTPLNQSKINAALALKKELQSAVMLGLPNSKHYLDILTDIEDAVAKQTTTKQNNYALNLPMYAAQQTAKTTTSKPLLQTQFSCLSDFLRNELGDNAVDEIEDRNSSQAGNSYKVHSCHTKILRLRSQGFDITDPKYKDFASFYDDIVKTQKVGYYLGDPNGSRSSSYDPGTHYDNIEEAFNHFKNDVNEYNKRYEEMMKYNAAIQIAIENSSFMGNDKGTRTLILMRTESDSVVTTKTKGEKTNHSRGVNESHSIIKTVRVGGGNLTMVRVPYSRINGLYMMAAGKYFSSDMYLGDGENEISADTHGLVIYFMKEAVNGGKSVTLFLKDFLKYEKNNP